MPIDFPQLDLVVVTHAHDREVLGQREQFGALQDGFVDQAGSGAQVLFDARRRHHLQRSDPQGRDSGSVAWQITDA
jgi:hypothetical protein